MIAPGSGEVAFSSRFQITAHAAVDALLSALPPRAYTKRPMPIEGWQQYVLGEHDANLGKFSVSIAAGPERRVEAVFLSHCHSFYEKGTPEDSERRAFHEGVIATELFGQREFPWGHVFCRYEPKFHRDWLYLVYNPFSSVPLQEREIYKLLMEHETIVES